MIERIVAFSIKNKLIILLFTFGLVAWGVWSLTKIPLGTVPDITNNQVQVITTSRNLATEDIEQFITFPIELEMGNLPGVQEIRSISKFGLVRGHDHF
jgi:cobalt-zinc-cadmium resistance protein CzcA